jgi:hypothetical protein
MTIQVETKYYYYTLSGERLEVITPDRVHPSLLKQLPASISIQMCSLNPGMSWDDIKEFIALTSPKKETYTGQGTTNGDGILHFAIDSTVISYARYDLNKKELLLRFEDSGSEYIYFDVSLGLVCSFLNSASKGAFFNADIRDKFKTAKFVS